MKAICLLCCTIPSWAQSVTASAAAPASIMSTTSSVSERATVGMTLSKQPSKIFEAAVGSRLKGVAGYAVRLCNTMVVPTVVSGGVVAQVIERSGVAVIPLELATMAANNARAHTILYQVAAWTAQAAYYASLAAGGLSAGSQLARITPSVIGHEAQRAKDSLDQQLPEPAERFRGQVLTDEDIPFAAGACKTRLFMGADVPGFTTMSGQVDVLRSQM